MPDDHAEICAGSIRPKVRRNESTMELEPSTLPHTDIFLYIHAYIHVYVRTHTHTRARDILRGKLLMLGLRRKDADVCVSAPHRSIRLSDPIG